MSEQASVSTSHSHGGVPTQLVPTQALGDTTSRGTFHRSGGDSQARLAGHALEFVVSVYARSKLLKIFNL